MPFTPEASGPAAAAAGGLPRSSGGPGAGPLGDARARMTLLDGQDNVVELEKSNVLLLGPTGAPPHLKGLWARSVAALSMHTQ